MTDSGQAGGKSHSGETGETIHVSVRRWWVRVA